MKFNRAFLVEPRRFEIEKIEENVKPNEVMVKIASCGLCNWELNFWKGNLNFYGYPHPLGHEYSGTIVETGKNVKTAKIGDKISCFLRGFGGFSEYKAVPVEHTQKLANTIDPKYALGEPQKCIVTVLRSLMPEVGDYGIVLGCGPMGLWTIMGLKGNQLSGLIAIDIDQKKLDMAKKYGATHLVNPLKENALERIVEITNNHMTDWVVEGTGIPEQLNLAQDFIKNSGRGKLVLMSSHEEVCKEFDFRKAIDKSLDIIVAHPDYSYDEIDDFRRAVQLINNTTFQVKDLISHEWKLSDINEAFKNFEKKPKGYLKGIVVPN